MIFLLFTMSLIISNELVQASGLSESELLQELVLLLFQREQITLGSASRFLEMTQLEFQALCIHYDVDELHEDVKNLQALGLL
jgi:predicted HTH domain antitoxin